MVWLMPRRKNIPYRRAWERYWEKKRVIGLRSRVRKSRVEEVDSAKEVSGDRDGRWRRK
jgi:hypothetical protein